MRLEAPKTLDEWNARGRDFLPGHMGLAFLHVARDRVEARFEVSGSHMSWNGFLHAGRIVTLADTCCGYGTVAGLPEGADGFTTLDLNANFLRTVHEGGVACVATPLHAGRTTQVWDATVTAEATGKTLAQFRCTQLILWPR